MKALGVADVLVIGGGPAGLAAAIAIRSKGLEVVVMDAASPPIDKACGEGIMPSGVEALRRLGVDLSSDDAFPLRGIRFIGDGSRAEAGFKGESGIALRRTRLQRILADRASEVGVRLRWGAPVNLASGLPPSRWIIGADGLNSRVRSAARLDSAYSESKRFGFRQHYRLAPWTDFVEVHWGTRRQIYVTPVGQDEIGVAMLSRDSHIRLTGALAGFPELRSRLEGAETSTAERGGVTVTRRLRGVVRGNTALIGDASGSVDAITGDGISLSFQQALALAQALCEGKLEAYEAEHRRIMRRPVLIARSLLCMERFPPVRRAALTVLAHQPAVFSKLLHMHAAGRAG